MKLIDADVADKWMRQNNAFIDAAILKAIPTIDAVPVVRCKNCFYYKPFGECNNTGLTVKPDDYCSYGARMEKEEDSL